MGEKKTATRFWLITLTLLAVLCAALGVLPSAVGINHCHSPQSKSHSARKPLNASCTSLKPHKSSQADREENITTASHPLTAKVDFSL